MRALAFVGVFLLSLAALPEDALAEELDCTAGCTIETCNATMCAVYYCRNGLCRLIGIFPKNQVNGTADQIADTERGAFPERPTVSEGGLNCKELRCVVKSCGEGLCSVFGFDQMDISLLGILEDTEPAFNQWVEDFLSTP